MKNIINHITSTTPRSAWNKGVRLYALELLDTLPDNVDYGSWDSLKADMLNGARDWQQYSECGFSLIYDADIAERLCSPSELKKVKGGQRNPNRRENWIDCQARAIYQAAELIRFLWQAENC